MRIGLALAAAVIAALVPAASAAPKESPGVLRAKIADAIAAEERAWLLLARAQPKWETARLVLGRSLTTLRDIRSDVDDNLAKRDLDDAISADIRATARISEQKRDAALEEIRGAIYLKSTARVWIRGPRTSGPQCADGVDNDGDRIVDARHDSGCADKKDGTERSPLTFRIALTQNGPAAVIEGSTSGPISGIEIAVPPGNAFDAKQAPKVAFSVGCRYPTQRTLECLMQDGQANPRHVVRAGFRLKKVSLSGLRVLLQDFAGRGHAQTVRPKSPAPPPIEPPFSLGPNAVVADGTFTNGRGGCPVATSFRDSFQFLAPGDGTLTIIQPSTGDRVSGPIKPDGSFQLRSAGESYEGRITGSTATATYSYTTAAGCSETYDAAFTLRR